jgi:hypothetical protein
MSFSLLNFFRESGGGACLCAFDVLTRDSAARTGLSMPKMLGGASAFEIKDIQEERNPKLGGVPRI